MKLGRRRGCGRRLGRRHRRGRHPSLPPPFPSLTLTSKGVGMVGGQKGVKPPSPLLAAQQEKEGARDEVVFDPRKVAALVRASLIQESIEAEAADHSLKSVERGDKGGLSVTSGLEGTTAGSGCKAASGGDEQSKRVKIEALAKLGHGEYSSSSQVRPLLPDVGTSKGSGDSVVLPMRLDGNGSSSKIAGDDLQVRTSPVCRNDSESEPAPLVACGPILPSRAGSGLDVEVEKQDLVVGEELSELGSNGKVVEEKYETSFGLVETVGLASAPLGPNSGPLEPLAAGGSLSGCDVVLNSIPAGLLSGVNGDSQPVCTNVRGKTAVLVQDLLPPAPGVNLQEWAMVAKDNWTGIKADANAAACVNSASGPSSSRSVPSSDPFPPLSRSFAGIAGASDLAVECGNGILDRSKGGPNYVEPNQSGGKKFSWQELLRTSKPADFGVDLHYVEPSMIDGEPCAVFTEEEEAENMKIWQHTLICYVVGKSPSYFQFLKAVTRLWKPPGGVEVFMRENGLFYCRFACEEDMNRVIKDGPWYMEGKLVVVKKFVGDTNCEETMLSSIPIWVKLPCLPVKWWSLSGVSKVVSVIGHPLYFDVPSASQSRIAYARCCVEVAMDRDLPSWINCIGSDKARRRQNIEYEWVPKKCSKCKMFGHLVADCNLVMNMDVAKLVVDQRKYKDVEQISNVSIGLQQAEWENPKGTKNRTEQQGAEKQSKLKMGMQDSINKVSMHNKKCGGPIKTTNIFHPLLNIDEEDPDVALNGGTHGKQACSDGDEPNVQHISEDEADAGIEEEGRGKEQVTETNKEGSHGMVDMEGMAIPPCLGAGSEGNDSGNQGDGDSMSMEDSDYTKSNKKKKRIRKKPAPIRPEETRTTRHSGSILKMNE